MDSLSFGQRFYDFSKALNVYAMTFITIIGIIGNVISLIIFSRKQYKRVTLKIYLQSLAVSDTIVLISHCKQKEKFHLHFKHNNC